MAKDKQAPKATPAVPEMVQQQAEHMSLTELKALVEQITLSAVDLAVIQVTAPDVPSINLWANHRYIKVKHEDLVLIAGEDIRHFENSSALFKIVYRSPKN